MAPEGRQSEQLLMGLGGTLPALGLFLQLYLEGPQDNGGAEKIAEAIWGHLGFSAHRRHQPEFLTQWYGVRLKNAHRNKFLSGSGVGAWLFGLLS